MTHFIDLQGNHFDSEVSLVATKGCDIRPIGKR